MRHATTRPVYVFLLLSLAALGFGCSQPDPNEGVYDPTPNGPPAAGGSATDPDKPSLKDGKTGPVLVTLRTSMGTIEVELWPDKSPITVANFTSYARKGHFDGTVFHRIVPGFVIQGGGFTPDMEQKPTDPPIRNEASNGLKNERGTLSMARTSDPDSATCQFYINLADNAKLDPENTSDGVGYAVFGKVTKGMDVVDKIAGVQTGVDPQTGMPEVPVKPVLIQSVKIRDSGSGEKE